MVEVFKTNVTNSHQARVLVQFIQNRFEGYQVNFDLDDCDHILRVEAARHIEVDPMIAMLKDMGVKAEALPDEADDMSLLLPPRCRLIIR